MRQANGSGRGPRDTPWKRAAVLVLVNLFGRWCQRFSRVIFFPGNLCIKYGRSVRLTEALTVDFLRQNTDVPVPKVYCAFEHRGTVYIAMQRLPGLPLARGWTTRDEASKRSLLQQLRVCVGKYRCLRRENNEFLVAAVDGGPILDERLPGTGGPIGPFTSVRQFHSHLRANYEPQTDDDDEIQRLITLHEQTDGNVCLTHNDLSSSNILVVGDRVTGLIDWENAAWLPRYWEYTSAWHVNPQNMYWQDEVGKFLDVFARELEMEQLRRKYFGDY